VSADVAAVKSDTAAILVDTGTTLDTLIKDIPTVAEFEARTLAAADYTVVSDLGTVQTGDSFARLGAPAGASVSADVAAVKSDTAAILTDTGTTLDTLIKDIPTVAEFEARTLPSADYVVVGDTLAAVTTAGSVTAVVNANVTKVNSVTIDGAGTALDPFGPA
jgi:hypothetical protein